MTGSRGVELSRKAHPLRATDGQCTAIPVETYQEMCVSRVCEENSSAVMMKEERMQLLRC